METITKRTQVILFAAPIFAAVISWTLSFMLMGPDEQLFLGMLKVAGLPGFLRSPGDPFGLPAMLMHNALILVFTGAGFTCGLRLRTATAVFAWIQLFVGALVLQVLLYCWFVIPGRPLGCSVALTLGLLCGIYGKWLTAGEERMEAQYNELIVRNRELLAARLQMLRQDELDRRSLAGDLHDQVLNDLKAVKQKVAALSAEEKSAEKEEIEKLLAQAMDRTRDVMENLSPSVLDNLGLSASIEDCLRQGGQRAGFKVRFTGVVDRTPLDHLPSVDQSMLYRIVQETVNNICKHSGAVIVRGSVEIQNNQVKIIIADDGKGFDVALVNKDSRGFKFMRQRADLIGATIAWKVPEGEKGTVVEITKNIPGRDGDESSSN